MELNEENIKLGKITYQTEYKKIKKTKQIMSTNIDILLNSIKIDKKTQFRKNIYFSVIIFKSLT